MAYRNGTYVAFDGNGTTDPTKGDLKYYALLRAWNESGAFDFSFSDSHKKTYQVNDRSSQETLKSRLLERMRNSKNMLLIISEDTNWDRGLLNFEIDKAVMYYEIPIIVAYTGYSYILDPRELHEKWPKSLSEYIKNSNAKCIHIPFRERSIKSAIGQFSIHSEGDNVLTGPLHFYNKEAYVNWGYIDSH